MNLCASTRWAEVGRRVDRPDMPGQHPHLMGSSAALLQIDGSRGQRLHLVESSGNAFNTLFQTSVTTPFRRMNRRVENREFSASGAS